MKLRIFWGIFAVAVAIMIVTCTSAMLLTQNVVKDNSRASLAAYAQSLASAINSEGTEVLNHGLVFPYRVTVIGIDGIVTFDSEVEAGQLSNHLERSEVQEALRNGTGESDRMSDTFSERTDYYAIRLDDGRVLRCSITVNTVFHTLRTVFGNIALIAILAALASALIAGRIARGIVKPINEVNLDDPLNSDIYDELTPLIGRLVSQQAHIAKQIRQIKRQNEEMITITRSMTEGLVLLNSRGEIINLNESAQKILSTDESAIGRNLLAVDHSEYIRSFYEGERQGHRPHQASFEKDGQFYEVYISRVGHHKDKMGYALIFVNTTASRQAEIQRREFTANVSHELKTPLQSIIGASELLQSGIVRPEDCQNFYQKIHREGTALLRMINDIILLSRLDEGAAKDLSEPLNGGNICQEIMASLKDKADAKGMSIVSQGSLSEFVGNYRYFYEMIFNLVDNAVKYGNEGGKISIALSEDERNRVIEVADDGPGISDEDQVRIFERFYRVDKSHSHRSEGTGLGLSIVKRAARYFGGDISVASTLGKGSCFKVVIPKSKRESK